MADFDLIFELSPRSLTELIRPQLMLNGNNYNPPADMAVPLPEDQGGGELHLVLTDLTIRLGPDAAISIMIAFERGSVVGSTRFRYSNLHGNITIHSRLTLDPVAMQPTQRALTLHLRRIERPGMAVDGSFVAVYVSSGSDLTVMLRIGLQQWVDNLPTNPSMLLPLQVDPSVNSSISPPIFRDLRLGSVAGQERQSLVLFANLLPGPAGRGDMARWRTTTLAPDEDTTLLISPRLFHELVFKPQVQMVLGAADPTMLPPTCGTAASIPYPPLPSLSITRVADTMREGRVEIELSGEQRGGGKGDPLGHTDVFGIRGSLTIGVNPPNQLVPRWRTEQTYGGTHFGWGTWLLVIFAAPLRGVMSLHEGLVAMGAAAAGSSFSLPSNPIIIPSFIPFTLRTAQITPEHLRLAGIVNPAPRRSPQPRLQLRSNLVSAARERTDNGTYQSTGCPEGQYGWERWRQNQVFTCTPSTSLAARPIRYRWQIMTVGGGEPELLRGPASVIERQAECFLPEIVPARRVVQTVRIQYDISEAGVLTLRNRPEDGLYHVGLICTATDADDRVMEQQAHFDFAGDQIVLGSRVDGRSTWAADFEACVQSAGAQMGMIEAGRGMMLDQAPLPHWVLVHRPPPWELAAFVVKTSLLSDTKAAQTLLEHAAILYGPSMITYMDMPLDMLTTMLPGNEKLDIEPLEPKKP